MQKHLDVKSHRMCSLNLQNASLITLERRKYTMSSDITLSSAQRLTLISLQRSSRLSDRTQVRLATGNQINTVTDGAESFFAARSLDNRAEILADRRGNIEQGLSTLQAALDGIDALDELLGQLRGLARQARSQTAIEREETTRSYNSVIEQFELVLEDTNYQGINLLNNTNTSLTVEFSERADSDLTVQGVNILASAASLGGIFGANEFISTIRNITTGYTTGGLSAGFSTLSNANSLLAIDEIDERLSQSQINLETRANSLGNNVAILQTRLNFNQSITTGLIDGADKITSADLNVEAANLTAIGTQYQIGVQALATSAQRLQSLLQIIR